MPPPRLPQILIRPLRISRPQKERKISSLCLTCCFSKISSFPTSRNTNQSQIHRRLGARKQSSLAELTENEGQLQPNDRLKSTQKLRQALIVLSKDARDYVNLSRLQLALRGLEQTTGNETIRVAIVGIAGNGQALRKARELVQLLLADPLKEEEEWERQLTAKTTGPVLVKIGTDVTNENSYTSVNRLVQEVHVFSPVWNSHQLEILVLESDISDMKNDVQESLAERILVPTIEIPTSNSGRYTPITMPVHKALILGDGVLGASSLLNLKLTADYDIIVLAADIPGIGNGGDESLPFKAIDVTSAAMGLRVFRESLDNAMTYEKMWFASGVPDLVEWLRVGTSSVSEGNHMKLPVRKLLYSVLYDTSRLILAAELRQNSILKSSDVPPEILNTLRLDLQKWAERAHTELRDQLNIAFEGNRWRKLGWWKLFWRVDDVSMISCDILNQRFLPEAEKEMIYLSGMIHQAWLAKGLPKSEENNWAFKKLGPPIPPTSLGSGPPPLRYKDILETPADDGTPSAKSQPWPAFIPAARSYLSTETVPALQALAQKLVLQSLTTSVFTSAFAGLIYVSSVTTGIYEAGAVAAFGIVWSLRRMQKKWETARSFWEGEVREEGRKSIRAVEGGISSALEKPKQSAAEVTDGLKTAKEALEKAERLLEELKKQETGAE